MYIYKFTNKINGKSYIGQTIQDPNQRLMEHLSAARTDKKKSHKFYNALRKYGLEGFDFEVIAFGITMNHLNLLEEWFVQEYDSIQNGYNLREPGNNKRHSEESLLRMSEAQKQAHARRRMLGRDGGWKRRDGGAMLGKAHPKKGKPSKKHSLEVKAENSRRQKEAALWKGKTWKLIDGKRVWMEIL